MAQGERMVETVIDLFYMSRNQLFLVAFISD